MGKKKSDFRYALGVDLGGTKIEAAIVREDGQIIQSQRSSTETFRGSIGIIETVAALSHQLIASSPFPISSVGVGVAGQVEKETGTVLFAPNLDWHGVPLKSELEAQLQLPVFVLNDVRAAAKGEWLYGAAKGCDDAVCLFFGTGIGGGIISGGQLIEGDNFSAGEVGHMVIDKNGPYCTCGGRGCWEAFAGGWAIAKLAQKLIAEDLEAGRGLLKFAHGFIGSVTAKTVAAAYAENDPLAQRIVRDVLESLTVGCISLVNVLNPQKLILGGGIITGFPHFIGAIEKGIRKGALKSGTDRLEVCAGSLNEKACVIGAAFHS